MDITLDSAYWNNRYREGSTGWDIGHPSTPLSHYIDQLTDPDMRILIPGCGNAWEALYLHEKGFRQVYLLDFAERPVTAFRTSHPGFPAEHILLEDFFSHHGHYDLVLEQTFFCAIDPEMRPLYAEKMAELIVPGGKLAGVLFNCIFEQAGPPFGGSKEEYEACFGRHFTIERMEPCLNSIPPRSGKELFVELIRP
ncbi:MAG: SAM-dependent methyltransferase [Bacteroidia bacterium]|nr:SAM-dependent methyltransferase [Bacteroidia bacterium]